MINNLITQKPRSPKERYNDIIALPRFFDKLRAKASGNLGEYLVGTESSLDNQLSEFLKLDFDKVFDFAGAEKTDEEYFDFIKSNFDVPSQDICIAWSNNMESMQLRNDPLRQKYSQIVIEKMGLPEDITTFDWLILGDM